MLETLQFFVEPFLIGRSRKGEVPYEANISLYDALKGTIAQGADNWQRERFICAHTILLALEGIPAFYIHSLLATENATEWMTETGARPFNQSLPLGSKKHSIRPYRMEICITLQSLKLDERIKIRKEQAAFHPNATQLTLHLGDQIFAFWRESLDRHQSIFAFAQCIGSSGLGVLARIKSDQYR